MADANSNKLTTRDLITTGVFTALYFVVLAVFGQLGALIPILQVLGPFYIPLICGIVFVLFTTRVHHFGMITIMGILVGLLVVVTGQSWVVAVLAVVLSPIADWLFNRASGDAPAKIGTTVVTYVIFSEMLIGMVVPLFFQREAFFERLASRKAADWVSSLEAMTPPWMFVVMIVMIAVGAFLGVLLGRAIFRKHFAQVAR
ncbi:MAG: MptD family putative ECF transporter S component [Propionibacteriaceae bacterium]|jgi:energy-coupling factor transport system substrate-specific component|nr:MptD family putative ECF transporter S component [Propionibacteriaceae bacterium]